MYWQIPIQIVGMYLSILASYQVAEQLSVSKVGTVDGTNFTCSAKMRFIRLQIYS